MTDARAELMQISAPGRVADAAARLHFALDLLALRGGLRLRCPWTIRTAPRATAVQGMRWSNAPP